MNDDWYCLNGLINLYDFDLQEGVNVPTRLAKFVLSFLINAEIYVYMYIKN